MIAIRRVEYLFDPDGQCRVGWDLPKIGTRCEIYLDLLQPAILRFEVSCNLGLAQVMCCKEKGSGPTSRPFGTELAS